MEEVVLLGMIESQAETIDHLSQQVNGLNLDVTIERERLGFWQGRYEGAAKVVDALKKDVEYYKEQRDIYRWWLEDSQERNRATNLRLLKLQMENAALKDGIDTIVAEFSKPLVIPPEWGSFRFVTVFAENPETGERIPVWLK